MAVLVTNDTTAPAAALGHAAYRHGSDRFDVEAAVEGAPARD